MASAPRSGCVDALTSCPGCAASPPGPPPFPYLPVSSPGLHLVREKGTPPVHPSRIPATCQCCPVMRAVCIRAVRVVKPQSFVRKTSIPTRAWRGINYGRSVSTPGAYNVFVKSTGRVHVTSDVYFTERYFPLRPKGTRHAGPEQPTRPADHGTRQPPGVPAPVPPPAASPPLPEAPPVTPTVPFPPSGLSLACSLTEPP